MTGRRQRKVRDDPATRAVVAGWQTVCAHPLFAPMAGGRDLCRRDDEVVPRDGWAVIDTDGTVHAHPTRLARPQEWAWVFAHLLLHLGLNHQQAATSGGSRLDGAHTAAADVVVTRFQASLKFGACPFERPQPLPLPVGDEASLAAEWRLTGVPAEWAALGVAGSAPCLRRVWLPDWPRPPDFPAWFAAGLSAAVAAAVEVAGGARPSMTVGGAASQPWQQARSWFINAYPLLAAVVSTLTVVADAELARAWDIRVAAVSPTAGKLYVNPHAQFSQDEWRFVIAHEALHAALAHHARVGGRDPYLFNVACDFVINGWLVEMGVGAAPPGLLYDPLFAGQSAEEVYDRIAIEARRYRKLATLRGNGVSGGGPAGAGDVLTEGLPRRVDPAAAVGLDELLRRGLCHGLDLHLAGNRGLLPAGLVEEIRALAHPPIGWDVALARWFDEYFPAVERVRTYLRLSRRSAATPDIPRPGHRLPAELVARRTFGVVLDTSGSMDAPLLGKALGAIASYAASHDVPAARVVFCDAVAYDAGYLGPDEIAGRVRVKGRGGTVLQPGIDLLQRADDFPADGPILVITDGHCDVLHVRRDHGYLIPAGAALPFTPKGPVFRVE